MHFHTPTESETNVTTTKLRWAARSTNRKTGDMPQAYVGNIEEAKESCQGCPLLKRCYHWKGSSQLAHHSISKSYLKKPTTKSLEYALRYRAIEANYIRIGVGGDPSICSRAEIADAHRQALDAGLKGAIGYTHFPKGKGKHLHRLLLASCDLTQADDLIARGWRVAIDLPFRKPGTKKWLEVPEWDGKPITTPGGTPVNICDAQVRATTCNSCGKCDPFDLRNILAIGFLLH